VEINNMPEIEIRSMLPSDLPGVLAIDHDYVSDHVWQMNVQDETGASPEDYQLHVIFRQQQLPRSVHVAYPRTSTSLSEDWKKRDEILVAILAGEVAGYISLMLNIAPLTAWATDLAVVRRHRRQGIGSGLVLAGQAWGHQKGCYRMVLEMQPKNYPAICLARKLGFDLCGYNDRYYPNHDIALFFAKTIR
jgi:ribosomal protein S18 acetylase RimI-like enzyme